MSPADTIFALSSGRGIAGVAVIRVSGAAARACAERIAGSCPAPRRAVLRRLVESVSGDPIDEGLVLWCPAPASFTGEDVVEFHVHGSPAVLEAMYETLGCLARPAEPGEFTRRAYRSGRMDLIEAEGLADLLEARTKRQRLQALHHLSGVASRVYEDWRVRLIEVLGRIEATVDFIEEGDVVDRAMADVASICDSLAAEMRSALAAESAARSVREGLTVVLAGLPNTGKSSLLNALARREAAIISPVPGTTRDIIEVEILLGGLPVLFRDTAGLRDGAADAIEAEGMARTRRAVGDADLVLWISARDVLESQPGAQLDSPMLWIENKADLPKRRSIRTRNKPDYLISAVTGTGMAALLRGLDARIEAIGQESETPTIVRARHVQAVKEALAALETSRVMPVDRIELLGEELRRAARCLGRITGRIDVEDLLDSIFASFCIGK